MGGTCSMQRQRALWREEVESNSERRRRASTNSSSRSSNNRAHRSSRHSVMSPVPDRCIASLYPMEDTREKGGEKLDQGRLKSLAQLCTETVCRSLVDLQGELPPGLPQEVVDDIVESLVEHSALNATTLGALKNCEIRRLHLSGCRGVTDQWLEPFANANNGGPISLVPGQVGKESAWCFHPDGTAPQHTSRSREHESIASSCSRSTSSFVSAISKVEPESDIVDHTSTAELEALEKYEDTIFSFSTLPENSTASGLTLLDLRGSPKLTDKGLLQLPDLPGLEVAKLDGCHALIGRGLLAFSASHRLHTLSLSNCRRLTDEAIINVSHLASMENLVLEGCRCLTDRALAALPGLSRLQKLDLSQCDLLTDSGLEHLDCLDNLEEVSMGWCRGITNRGINIFTAQPGRERLRVFHLARCLVTDDGVDYLGRLSGLVELNLNGCSRIGGHALARTLERIPKLEVLDVSYCPGILRTSWQGKIPSLRTLELCFSGVQDSHMAKLSDLPNLEELNLDSCCVGDWTIAHLADNNVVPNLKSLDLSDTDVSDLSMVHVAKLTKLTRLSLFYANISNGGLRHISNLTSLEVLNLDSREISDSGLTYLRNLKNLRCLDLFSGRISDSGCAHISQIKSLEALELCGGGIGDLGCQLISELENLTNLNISQNDRITNRGASALAPLTKLKSLNLSHTRVNASGQLRLPISLTSLAMLGCVGIDDAKAVSALQSSLPALKCLRLNPLSDEDGMMFGDDAAGASDSLCLLRMQTFDPSTDAALSRRALSAGLRDVDDVDIASELSTMDDRDGNDMENESFYSNLD
ncbi:F-box LRR-repeat protein [Seminavis robusta]|uniref:F-box LRR-repeat protein n=1 Tax=Seminavis robusta TaxID=568900 RepID=A0A9N8EUE5_9STRA|nr:F-box LRR-repeat protein [Seminavis robusta]|eukprot:Sro1993_g309890.1 F-box LRR-repeat protein (814) ;mRNA; r:3528-6234